MAGCDRHSLLAMLALALVCMCDAGCSALAVAGPPPNAATYDYVHCTSSRFLPVLDTVAAIGSAVPVAIFAPRRNSGPSAAVFGVIAVAYGASADYGFVATARCADAQDEAESRRRQRAATSSQDALQ